MNASSERVFYYHADANPIGGQLTHPSEAVLQSEASVSLSQAGGNTSKRSESFNHANMIRTGAHYSQTTGSVHKQSGNWTTIVTTAVEDLNMLEVVTADRMVAQLSIEHSRVAGQYYPKVTLIGTQYENLRIAGRAVTPAVNLDLFVASDADRASRSNEQSGKLSLETEPNLIEFPDLPWPEMPAFLNTAILQSSQILKTEGVPEWLRSRFDWIASSEQRAKRGYVLASIVNGVHNAAPGSSFGHVVQVPGFGNIFLGELIVTPLGFDLTMLRAEMGCLADGTVSICSGRGNGFPSP